MWWGLVVESPKGEKWIYIHVTKQQPENLILEVGNLIKSPEIMLLYLLPIHIKILSYVVKKPPESVNFYVYF